MANRVRLVRIIVTMVFATARVPIVSTVVPWICELALVRVHTRHLAADIVKMVIIRNRFICLI